MPRRSSGAQCPWVGWGTWLRAFPEEPWTSFWSKACRGEWGWSKEASFTKGLVFRWIYFHHHRENWKKFMYSRSVYFCKFSILKFFKHINSLRNKSGKPPSLFFCLLTRLPTTNNLDQMSIQYCQGWKRLYKGNMLYTIFTSHHIP